MTDDQTERGKSGCLGAVVLLVIGVILLLPGLCVVLFATDGLRNTPNLLSDPNVKAGQLIFLAALIVSGALGVWLIVMAIRKRP